MIQPQKSKERLPSEVLKKFASVMMGKSSPHLTRPFASVKFIALKQWLEEISRMNKKTHPNFFRLLEARINLSEVSNINKLSETTKLNLHIADSLKKEDDTERRPIFEL